LSVNDIRLVCAGPFLDARGNQLRRDASGSARVVWRRQESNAATRKFISRR
jgi:hypothetical protein